MGLSRLQNFLKSARGNILYVNPNDLDATDSIENQGNSLTRPFKTIQRALVEAARFSYQAGLDNDRFGQTTIMIYPGDHVVDNRPGWIPYDDGGTVKYRRRNGDTNLVLSPFDLTTNFDLESPNNDLYKLNSVHGGVIIPRGTSLVGTDLRKTKIRPKYVPNPENNDIERSTIFRVTGASYYWQFSIFDADPNGTCYKDYTDNIFVPNFSHHKLTCFEYADGVNDINIDDEFITYSTDRTDLEVYYQKVGDVYDQASGRQISPDFPAGTVDIQPKIDEYRIVGSKGAEVGISSIKSGDGVTGTKTITVTTSASITPIGLEVDTPVRIKGVSASGYNGNHVVSSVQSDTEFSYNVSNIPTTLLENPANAVANIVVDTVTSASPYIFNVSLRSVFGMCGMLADGAKADGFKSMVVAQFTGIGLQKDNNAFIKYNESTGNYDDSTTVDNLSSDSRAIFKPEYANFHIKCANDSILQLVSIFAIGYAEHFVAESGGDQSVTNSNSNFGAKSLVSRGYKSEAFAKDDVGYLTHILPPKKLETVESAAFEYDSIDVAKTISVGNNGRLYIYNQTNEAQPPRSVVEGYRVGAKVNDTISSLLNVSNVPTQYSSRVTMPINGITTTQYSSSKQFEVGRSVGINSISSNIITLTQPHNFINGESVRVISENGNLPDGVKFKTIYFAITSENTNAGFAGTDQIQLATTLKDALSATAVELNNLGGPLKLESRVSDKLSGNIGHPIQYDSSENQWYINVSTASTETGLYDQIVGLGTTALGAASPRTFFERQKDDRPILDTVYRLRYVIPSTSGITSARPPVDGYVIQQSNSTGAKTDAEAAALYSPTVKTISNVEDLRNPSYISTCTYSGSTVTVDTERPHNVKTGFTVKLVNVTSTNNTTGVAGTGFNRDYIVTSTEHQKRFTVGLSTDPGTFTNNVSIRDKNLPRFEISSLDKCLTVYRSQEISQYEQGQQDGIYHILANATVAPPTSTYHNTKKFNQNIQYFYPSTNRDNPKSDPKRTNSHALNSPIGEVVIDDTENSLTKESTDELLIQVGNGITNIQSNPTGTAHTIFTSLDHGFSGVTKVSIASSGALYGVGSGSTEYYYGAEFVGLGGSTIGENAKLRVTVHPSGGIDDILVMDGGSAYLVGNQARLGNIPVQSGYTDATINITGVADDIGTTLDIQGITSTSYSSYNTLYKITEIEGGESKKIKVISSTNISNPQAAGIGTEVTDRALMIPSFPVVDVASFVYDNVSGIATFTTVQKHGLVVDNKIRIGQATESFYNGDFVVSRVSSNTTFVANVGVNTLSPSTSTATLYYFGLSSQGGTTSNLDENLSGRGLVRYAGITTTLSSAIPNTTTNSIYLDGIATLDLRIGDYLKVDDEILRISSSPSTGIGDPVSNPVTVLRGVLGSGVESHDVDSIVRRINPLPLEFRRNSIIRASGHTFEYVGYGPGNYSTALPERIDRKLSPQEELLAQSTKENGGINVYTGMNNDGDFFIGNKKVSSATGEEEVFDAPVPTVVGEDIGETGVNVGFDVLTPLEAQISRSIKVEGGPNANIISEFDGPVIFTNKITSTSVKGIESQSLFLQGNAQVSRNITVGISTPILAGTAGDIVFNANPVTGGYSGWIYTVANEWVRFGTVGLSRTENHNLFDRVGIATTSAEGFDLMIGNGGPIVAVGGSIGIGSTQPTCDIDVVGDICATGIVTAGFLYGDGSFISNLPTDSKWDGNSTPSGAKLGIHTGADPDDFFVGIGTTTPTALLTIGIGTTTTDKAFKVQSSSGTELIGITSDGKLGINKTSPGGLLDVGGQFISTQFSLDGSSGIGTVYAGIVTASSRLDACGILTVTTGAVAISTSSARSLLDVDGRLRFKSHHESVESPSVVSNEITLNLAEAQSFSITLTDDVTQVNLSNIPTGSSSFTVKLTQDSTGGHSVGFSVINVGTASSIPVYWSGGVVPIQTVTADATDLYSFITMDSGATLYGVIGGQNFS